MVRRGNIGAAGVAFQFEQSPPRLKIPQIGFDNADGMKVMKIRRAPVDVFSDFLARHPEGTGDFIKLVDMIVFCVVAAFTYYGVMMAMGGPGDESHGGAGVLTVIGAFCWFVWRIGVCERTLWPIGRQKNRN